MTTRTFDGVGEIAAAETTERASIWMKLWARLFNPVDIAPLVMYRIAFGAIMLWEVWRYFLHDRVARYYIEPQFYFPYPMFEWLSPLPGNGMFLFFQVLGVLAFCIMIGAFYRIAMPLFFLGFTYFFLLDETQYLNHFYLVSLLSFLMIFMPLNRGLSVDALRNPRLRSETVPTWVLWTLLLQLGMVYFWGGIAKINGDWLAGEPIRDWLWSRTDFPVIGQFFREEWMVMTYAYGGLMFDLFIAFALLWRWTRIPAVIAMIMFHWSNDTMFSIGIFPLFMASASLLFLPPHWFRLGKVGEFLGLGRTPKIDPPQAHRFKKLTPWQTFVVIFLASWFAVQVFMPLRHWLYPSVVHWSEEGHRWAWHMKLRSKDSVVQFIALDPNSGQSWEIDPDYYLNSRQERKMSTRPYMIHQFARFLADEMRGQGYDDIEIHVWAMASLNGRPYQKFIDETVDLGNEPYSYTHVTWIEPLTTPLRPDGEDIAVRE